MHSISNFSIGSDTEMGTANGGGGGARRSHLGEAESPGYELPGNHVRLAVYLHRAPQRDSYTVPV